MNYRIVVMLLIAAAIGGVGWNNARRLSQARENLQRARDDAARLGIVPGQSGRVVHQPSVRRTKVPLGKQLMPDDITFANEIAAARNTPGASIPNSRERFAAITGRFNDMTPAQIQRLVEDVRANEELSLESRNWLVQNAIGSLFKRSPGNGLDVCLESLDLLPEESAKWLISRGLGDWAARDPAAALAWIRRNLADHADLISNEARCAVITGTAKADRKLAFRLIGEFDLDNPADATQGIVGTAKTPQDRIAALADLREYLPTIEDESTRWRAGDYAIAVIGRVLAKDGFQAASEWAGSAGLAALELASFASDIGTSIKDGDQGKWADWLGQKLADGYYQRPIRQVMLYWTQKDHKAAALWLNSAAAGPVKNFAIRVFAAEVANHQPEAAIPWALTLPTGPERDEILDKIYHNWPKKDPAGEAAAAAFEKEYQIKHHH